MKLQFLALAGVCLVTASAQSSGPSPVLLIGREVIKEGRGAAHEKTDADYARALRKARFPYHEVALASMSGQNEVWFVFGYQSFADLEKGGKEFDKQPLKGEIEQQDARDGEHRVTSRALQAVYRKDMSFRPELANLGKTRFVNIISFRVKLGHDDDFLAGAKMFVGAEEKANLKTPILAYEVVAGAPSGLYLFIEPMESLNSLDEQPARGRAIAEAMGADNYARLMKGSGDVFVSIENSLFAVDPLLSYVSKEVEDVDGDFWRPKAPAAKPATEKKEKTGH
jgi:hypothetical protein